jgi:hypothetical protein
MHQLTIVSRELRRRQRIVTCAVQTSSVKVSLAVGVAPWTSRANSWVNSPSGLPTVFVPTVLLNTKIETYILESILSTLYCLVSAEPVESQSCYNEKTSVGIESDHP